ncbi:MAG: tRNA (N6-threonylcarbamoyladenosine(37)-N6)-methyltransferase TrmO [Prevotella sp.]|nr:tRNA (N6-threonylcarbamoyladenosine(37)-N6)-methyltransferase TrmO [Prevotella sp.]
MKEIRPIAHFRSPLTSKFGIPRQSGLANSLQGQIVMEKPFDNPDALRGLDGFDYVWLIWDFSANHTNTAHSSDGATSSVPLTVRPPRLGGNRHMGVFATRSPFRPNGLGLSCVRIAKIEAGVIHVTGADLMDGTPIYDIKPYIPYADAHPEARGGFTDEQQWQPLAVEFPDNLSRHFSDKEQRALVEILQQDPRPQYHDDPERIYGMPFAGRDVRFKVCGQKLTVIEVRRIGK